MDIASLGIKVQTQGVAEADKQLDSFAKTSERAEQSVKSAATTINKGFKPDTAGIKAQREELAKLVGQIDPAVAALDRLDKQERQLRAFRSKGLVDSGTFADLTQKLNANREALSRFRDGATSAGLSAKQLAQATRQLPMQFTDIFTSLASGQRPMQVLLQQGGQLKDVFGGIGPALRAAGGYIAGLINPLTIAIGVVAGLGAAWKTAQDEAQAFNLAIIETGGHAGHTADDLKAMAERLDDTTAATQRFASEVITQVEATGRFTGQQVETVSTAITNMAQATKAAGGDADAAIKSLTKSFTDLSKDPVDALLRLNETQHFLTQSTLDQVQALEEQGKHSEAVEVAIKALADTTNDRAKQMEGSLNSVNAVWRDMRSAIGEAWDGVVGFFRDADAQMQTFLRNHEAGVRRMAVLTRTFNPFAPNIADSLINNAKKVPEPIMIGFKNDIDSAKARKKIKDIEDAQRGWNSAIRQGETDTQRLNRELKELEKNGKLLNQKPEEIKAAQDALRASFAKKGPKGRKPPKVNTRGIENASDRFDDMVGGLRSELEGPLERAEQQHIKRMREIEQAARDGKRSHEDLAAALKLEGEAYAQSRTEIEQRIDAEVASLSGPMAQAQAQHEEALRRIEDLKKTGRVTGDEYTAMLREEAKAHDEAVAAARRAEDPIGALLSDMREELDLIGLSNSARAVMIELRRNNVDAMSAEGQAALTTAKMFEEEAKAKQRSIELMDEFRGGASNALADIVTGAKSAKEAFADFFDDLARRITQMIAEKWIERAFGSFGTNGQGTQGGDWLGKFFGALFGGGSGGGFADAFAKGGAFAGGVQKFAAGGVVNSPTMFRMGLMGEAGPEAILPLHRGPDGKLGVRMEAPREASQQPRITRMGDTYIKVDGAPNRKTLKQLERANGRGARREMARTGG